MRFGARLVETYGTDLGSQSHFLVQPKNHRDDNLGIARLGRGGQWHMHIDYNKGAGISILITDFIKILPEMQREAR